MSDPDAAADTIPRYAAAGLAVVPLHTPNGDGRCSCGHVGCLSVGKHPRLRHGVHDATTDLGQVAEWLARWPDANWGITPGPGQVVLDIDPRHRGDVVLADLEALNGDLPRTLTCRTGSGGWHYWYRYDGRSRGKLAEGVDIKKAGGYLVVPPSVHACGGTYTWTDQRRPTYAPRWVRDLLDPIPPPRPAHGTRLSRGQLDALTRFLLDAPEGERNSRLYWAAARAYESGADTAVLLRAAEHVGLPRREAQNTIASAAHAPARPETPLSAERGRRRGHARH